MTRAAEVAIAGGCGQQSTLSGHFGITLQPVWLSRRFSLVAVMSTGALYERTETTGPLTATISHGSTRSGVYIGLQVTGLHRT